MGRIFQAIACLGMYGRGHARAFLMPFVCLHVACFRQSQKPWLFGMLQDLNKHSSAPQMMCSGPDQCCLPPPEYHTPCVRGVPSVGESKVGASGARGPLGTWGAHGLRRQVTPPLSRNCLAQAPPAGSAARFPRYVSPPHRIVFNNELFLHKGHRGGRCSPQAFEGPRTQP